MIGSLFLYFYVQTPNSAVRKGINEKSITVIDAYSEIEKEYYNDFDEAGKAIFAYTYIRDLIGIELYLRQHNKFNNDTKKEYDRVKKEYRKIALKSPTANCKQKILLSLKMRFPNTYYLLNNTKKNKVIK